MLMQTQCPYFPTNCSLPTFCFGGNKVYFWLLWLCPFDCTLKTQAAQVLLAPRSQKSPADLRRSVCPCSMSLPCGGWSCKVRPTFSTVPVLWSTWLGLTPLVLLFICGSEESYCVGQCVLLCSGFLQGHHCFSLLNLPPQLGACAKAIGRKSPRSSQMFSVVLCIILSSVFPSGAISTLAYLIDKLN